MAQKNGNNERSIAITSPNGGEDLIKGQTYLIEWDSNLIDSITVSYLTESGSLSHISKGGSAENTGSYLWDIPSGFNNGKYKIQIIGYETGKGSVVDQSDNYFNIIDHENFYPDLEILNISGPIIQNSDSYLFTVNMKNNSNIDIVGPFDITWVVIDDEGIEVRGPSSSKFPSFFSLKAWKEYSNLFSLAPSHYANGNYQVKCILDYNKKILESNEDNNEKIIPFSISVLDSTPESEPTSTLGPTTAPEPAITPTPTSKSTLLPTPISISESAMTNKITIRNKSMHSRLKGRIILKVEDKGKAYYINPKTETMHYLGRPDDAFSVMREQGVGITNINLGKIPVGLGNLTGSDTDRDGLPDSFEDAIGTNKNNMDSDGDSYNDKIELGNGYNPNGAGKLNIDDNFSGGQKGKIFLQVERNGEAWYVNPVDMKRYFLGRPADAFQVMRNLGLGISDNDFDSMK